jgi:hypothetical protein
MTIDITDITNHTAYDIVLAGVYLPILIRTAKNRRTITYGELVQTGKELHPDNNYVQGSIPVTAGRRLNVLRQTLREHSLPDLSCLVVSASSGKTGDAYHLKSSEKELREAVFSTDWDQYQEVLDNEISKIPYDEIDFTEVRRKSPKPKPPSRQELLDTMSDYWKENGSQYPKWVRTKRDVVIDLLFQGYPVEECFNQLVEENDKGA